MINPWWLAAIQVMKPTSSILADRTWTKLYGKWTVLIWCFSSLIHHSKQQTATSRLKVPCTDPTLLLWTVSSFKLHHLASFAPLIITTFFRGHLMIKCKYSKWILVVNQGKGRHFSPLKDQHLYFPDIQNMFPLFIWHIPLAHMA